MNRVLQATMRCALSLWCRLNKMTRRTGRETEREQSVVTVVLLLFWLRSLTLLLSRHPPRAPAPAGWRARLVLAVVAPPNILSFARLLLSISRGSLHRWVLHGFERSRHDSGCVAASPAVSLYGALRAFSCYLLECWWCGLRRIYNRG